MSGKKREYSSLDSVFNRLQVTPQEERHGDVKQANGQSGKVERVKQLVEKKLKAKRRRKSRKCVIRKAKLILPKTYSAKNKCGIVNQDDTDDDDDDVFHTDSESCTPGTPITCGAQYLQQGSTSLTTGTEDSSPDELASYFEQILFIPKPMSLMAQMMYA